MGRFKDTWVNQTKLGEQFGMSAVAIGKKLVELGLRGEDKQPTPRALKEGIARFAPMKDGRPFYLWNAQQVAAALEETGMVALSQDEQDAREIALSLVNLEKDDSGVAHKVWDLTMDETPPRLYPLIDRFLAELGAETRLGAV